MFTPRDQTDRDMVFFFIDVEGELGVASTFGPMVDLAMSGMSTGGNVAQHTDAQMRASSPAAREARIREVLRLVAPEHVRALSRWYQVRVNAPSGHKPPEWDAVSEAEVGAAKDAYRAAIRGAPRQPTEADVQAKKREERMARFMADLGAAKHEDESRTGHRGGGLPSSDGPEFDSPEPDETEAA